SLGSVVEAVRNSNENVGGNVLEANGTWSIVRGVGLVESIGDLENIVIAASGGVPVYVRQVGEVHVGDAFRVASLVKGNSEAVGGVVVMRSGANAQQVIDAVRSESIRSLRVCRLASESYRSTTGRRSTPSQ